MTTPKDAPPGVPSLRPKSGTDHAWPPDTRESSEVEVVDLGTFPSMVCAERDRLREEVTRLREEVTRLRGMAIMFDHATTCTIYNSIDAPEHDCNCGWENEGQDG